MSAVKQTHRALAVELVSKLGCWGRDMSGQPNALGHIDLDLVAQALADIEAATEARVRAELSCRDMCDHVPGCPKFDAATKEEPTDGKA